MALPVIPVIIPAALAGTGNGRLSSSILTTTPGQAGGPTVTLVASATRSWRALCAAAKAAGHTLKATSASDSYRSYAVQEAIFRQRYQTGYIPGVETKVWQGQTWYKRPGYAAAAVPGTSNHGWALAVDTGEESDGDLGAESLDAKTLAWLVANELRYGWSHELQSEPWHIHYFAGDAIPAAVLAYEQGGDDMTPAQELQLYYTSAFVQQLIEMRDPIVVPPRPDLNYKGYTGPNLLAQAVRAADDGSSVGGEVVVAPASVQAIAKASADETANRLAD